MKYSINDFPAWLSPIIVRELRLGIRSLSFLIGFSVLQTILLCWGITLTGSNTPSGNDDASSIFWAAIFITFIGLFPARLFKSVNEEMEGARWEMLTIAGFSSFKMIFSKWLSVSVQSLIVWISILPFFIAHFFAGNVNIVYGLKCYTLILIGSYLISAIVLYVSSWKFLILRGLAIAGLVFGVSGVIGFTASIIVSSYNTENMPIAFVVLIGVLCVPAIVVLLLAAAEKLSHPSENLGVMRARFSLLSLISVPAFLFTRGLWDEPIWATILIIYSIIFTICEFIITGIVDDPSKSITSRNTNKYSTGGRLKKIFGHFFIYQTRIRPQTFIGILLVLCSACTLMPEAFTDSHKVMVFFISILASIMLANAFSTFFSKNSSTAFWVFLSCIYAVPWLIIFMIATITRINPLEIEMIFLAFPPLMLGTLDLTSFPSPWIFSIISLIYGTIAFLITYLRERKKIIDAEYTI